MMESDEEDAKGLVRDILEIGVILAAIIILSKLFLGAHMLVPLVAVTSCSMYHEGDFLGVGCPVYHSGDWDGWLLRSNISRSRIESFPLRSGFSMGDMILTIAPGAGETVLPIFSDTPLGDVIIYERDRAPHKTGDVGPIIHRVVGIVSVRDWRVVDVTGTLSCLSVEDFEDRYIGYVRDCVDGGVCYYSSFPETGDFSFYITKGDNNPGVDQCPITNSYAGDIALPVTDAQLTARGWIRIPFVGWAKLLLSGIIDFIF